MQYLAVTLLICTLSSVYLSENQNHEVKESTKSDMKELKKGTPQSQQKANKPVKPNNKVRYVVEIIGFSASVAAFLFFILLRICPPLCRWESGSYKRRYLDTQIKVGEIF
jgi:hypothetical protein